MYYAYILLSESETKTYTGCTKDLKQRLEEHNSGRVKSSYPFKPFRLLHTEEFTTLKEARRRERFFKSTSGRRKIKELLTK